MKFVTQRHFPLKILCVLLIFGAAGVAISYTLERFETDAVEQHFTTLKPIAVSRLTGLPKSQLESQLQQLLKIGSITGVEIFSPDGRRVAAAGEPLKIVGYELSMANVLTHIDPGKNRHEVFWSAEELQASFGLALRTDPAKITSTTGLPTMKILGIILLALLGCRFTFYLPAAGALKWRTRE